jgi:phage virion morphogenesis protein
MQTLEQRQADEWTFIEVWTDATSKVPYLLLLVIDDAALNRAIGGLLDRVNDLTPALRDIGEYMVLATRDRFDDETSPDGVGWKPLNARYAARKAAQSGNLTGILKRSSLLRDSIAYEVGPDFVVMGTNRIYGPIHQLGGQAGRNRSVNIPARPFLGLSLEDTQEVVAILTDYGSSELLVKPRKRLLPYELAVIQP